MIQPLDALVGLCTLPWVNNNLHDHKPGKGNRNNLLGSVQSIIFRWEVFSLAVLLYIGLFLRHPNFSTCLASKESQGKNSVCLEDLKKEHGQENKGCFAGCDFAKLEWCFILFKCEIRHTTTNLQSKPRTHWERQRRWFYNILPDHNIVFSGVGYFTAGYITAAFLSGVVQSREAKGQGGDERGAEVGTPSSWTLNWHWDKLKSKQNCPCLYKQLDCTLREDKGMKLCPYKVTLIFYLSNKKKHRREVRGRWRKNTQVLRPEKWKTKFGKDRNTCTWSTQKTPLNTAYFSIETNMEYCCQWHAHLCENLVFKLSVWQPVKIIVK